MNQVAPIYLSISFFMVVLLTIYWFFRATGSKVYLLISIIWLIIQSIIGLSGMYLNTDAVPPRIMLFGIFPTVLLILFAFFSKSGKQWMNKADLKSITYFHTIRVPVELVLTFLYHQGLISVLMTFEGTNFDIFSGLSAPFIAFMLFTKKDSVKRNVLLAWNAICLLLLLNVVITAIFAFPSPFQKLAFDQPNIGILHFPFNLLPSLIVPTVIMGHLIAFHQLRQK